MSFKTPYGSVVLNPPKQYPRLTSGPNRNKYLHRVVWETVAGREIPSGFNVHHMNGKYCFCPHHLVCLPAEFNPSSAPRDPYTGEYLSIEEFKRRYN